MSKPRVLVLHNRYRVRGGEERAVELHVDALARAGVPHATLFRDSSDAGALRAGRSLVRGGERPEEVTDAARELGAGVLHVHNMQPLFGPRALEAGRAAGARVVMHLHNYRLFCAIAVCFRDGAPCFRCHHGRTLPGFALNCRGSLPESAAYAYALSSQLERVLAAVHTFITPSEFARGQLERLGLPAERVRVLPHYLEDEAFEPESRASEGSYALMYGRLSEEKGLPEGIEAARRAGVPLKVAGDGPLMDRLRDSGAELLGRVPAERLAELRRGAAAVLVPSRSDETFGLAALEAMGAGVPVIATRAGALPELVGDERCVPRGDVDAMAERLRRLWNDAALRSSDGEALLARARERYTRERFTGELLAIYAGAP
ncbi:MAG: glycosyltransferase family 4 protein [Thermoleophilaceae bacterium]